MSRCCVAIRFPAGSRPAIIHFIDYRYHITSRFVKIVLNKTLWINQSRRFLFELVYPSCFVEYNVLHLKVNIYIMNTRWGYTSMLSVLVNTLQLYFVKFPTSKELMENSVNTEQGKVMK